MKPITDKEFITLVDYIKRTYGVNLYQKKMLVAGRLQNHLVENNFKSFTDYYNFVLADKTGDAATILINKLTTNHTFFMREPQHFEIFKNEVLPYLESAAYAKKDLRIWSAGCSTGEESYTLAMLVADYFGKNKSMWDTKILATDISTKVLDIAVQGIYREKDISSLPDTWRRKHFINNYNGNFEIVDKIKNDIIYRKFNLINGQFPFKRKFHVIFCRNVMIYFDAETKRQLVNKFYEHTEEGGYLFIGHSEALNREETNYKYIMPAVFRK